MATQVLPIDQILSKPVGFYHSKIVGSKQPIYAARTHEIMIRGTNQVYYQVLLMYLGELTWISCDKEEIILT